MDLPIEGMHCASCVLSVNKTFEKIEGVEEVDADLAANKLHLTVNTKKISYEEMERKIKNLLIWGGRLNNAISCSRKVTKRMFLIRRK